jgi:hypothetical protein
MKNRMMVFGALVLVGCGGADLPEGWETAKAIEGLTQTECKGSALDETIMEQLVATPEAGAVRLKYNAAHFRCEQEVEGFVRIGSGKVDVLVQPVDMDPSAVAGCDCLYDIGMAIKGLPKGAVDVELYRRWDNINDPNDPEKVGSAEVQVP